MDSFVLRCLAKSPEERPQSAVGLFEAFQAAFLGEQAAGEAGSHGPTSVDLRSRSVPPGGMPGPPADSSGEHVDVLAETEAALGALPGAGQAAAAEQAGGDASDASRYTCRICFS